MWPRSAGRYTCSKRRCLPPFVAVSEAAAAETELMQQSPPPVRVPDEEPFHMQPPSDHHLLQMARAREAAAAQRQHALVAEVRHYRSVIRRNKPIALDPTSKWLRVWDACFLGPAMLWSASVTPFEIGFLPFAFNSLWHANRIIDLILFLDLCLQFIIGYREHPSQGGGSSPRSLESPHDMRPHGCSSTSPPPYHSSSLCASLPPPRSLPTRQRL